MAAPGVPRELVAMMDGPFLTYLDKVFPERINDHQVLTIRTFGVPEEKIFFELMPDLWEELSAHGKVSSLPQVFGVDIHLTFRGDTKDLNEKRELWKNKLKDSPLASHIWAYEFIDIETFVVREATKKKVTLGAAESCTGGLLASRLTNVSGSSAVFLGSIVSYANEVKENVLGVKNQTLTTYGAVSEETAKEMVEGAIKTLNCDIAISLTGIAGPTGGSDEKPVGMVCMGVHSNKSESPTQTHVFKFKGRSRDHLKLRFSEMALHLIRKEIENY